MDKTREEEFPDMINKTDSLKHDELGILKSLSNSFENLYSNLMLTKEKIDKLNSELRGDKDAEKGKKNK